MARINYIDRIKGFVMLVVVLAHVYLFSLGMSETLVYKFCASFEMPLFMFISGFVAYITGISNQAMMEKLRKRFFSYLCPAVAVSYSIALYRYLILGCDVNFVYELTGGLWYLKALAIFVCLQAIFLKCKSIYCELGVFVFAEILFLVGSRTSPFLNILLCLEQCFFFYPFFVMGYYFRKYNLMNVLKSKNWIFTLSLLAFICLLNINFEIHLLKWLAKLVIIPFFAVLAIVYLFAVREDKESKIERWLSDIGTKTLDIYMYHGIFFSGAFSCIDLSFVKRNDFLMANPLLCLVIALLVTMFSTYMSIYVGMLVRRSHLLDNVIYGHFFK